MSVPWIDRVRPATVRFGVGPTASLIDRAFPRSIQITTAIPQSFNARLEHRRSAHGEIPMAYIDQWHDRIKWSRFALTWCAIGAQMALDGEEW